MYCILVYDIVRDEEGARVTRRIFKTAKRFLTHIQNSVFEGDLSEAKIYSLSQELKKWLRSDRDSCILFQINNAHWLKKDFLTEKKDDTSAFF